VNAAGRVIPWHGRWGIPSLTVKQMVRTFQVETAAPLPPADMFALKLHEDFDSFCCKAEGCRVNVVSVVRETAADGTSTVAMEQEVTEEEVSWLPALQLAFGAKHFAIISRSRFFFPAGVDDGGDQSFVSTFENTMQGISQRCVIRGQSWLESVAGDPTTCLIKYVVDIDVRIPAVSSLIEHGLEKRLRESYLRLPDLVAQYIQTDAGKAFLEDLASRTRRRTARTDEVDQPLALLLANSSDGDDEVSMSRSFSSTCSCSTASSTASSESIISGSPEIADSAKERGKPQRSRRRVRGITWPWFPEKHTK
jgi:hypothetical protein